MSRDEDPPPDRPDPFTSRPSGTLPAALRGRRPTWIEVDLDALAWNLGQIRRHLGAHRRILAVVKADAYGHGAVPIALRLEAEGCDMLGVATTEEGLLLREAGVGAPVLVLGPADRYQVAAMADASLIPSITTLTSLRAVIEEGRHRGRPIPVHLKIDTGMGRLGLLPSQIPAAIETFRTGAGAILLQGAFTHLASSDDPDDSGTRAQIECFDAALARLHESGLHPAMTHAANSGGILDHPDSWFDMVRPGILLYGAHPSPRSRRLDLLPVLSFRTRLVLVKDMPAGSPIGYGRDFTTRRSGPIGTIPAGYADGLSRILATTGGALVRGQLAPYAGRISMDYAMLDLTGVSGAAEGDEVVLLGRQQERSITAETFAAWAGTIPWEALCGIGGRVPRFYVQSGTLREFL